MKCIVTAGPTYEPMDKVRRLTNFSTGRLGIELANFLSSRGHEVELLLGELASWRAERPAYKVTTFSTTENLATSLQALAAADLHAVFHAAAVSDYRFGRMYSRTPQGELMEIQAGKIATRDGLVMAELVPTMKIIRGLRQWYPRALLVGWKYEVDGDRAAVITKAQAQIKECSTDLCIANGPAYGLGFGVIGSDGRCDHVRAPQELYTRLESMLMKHPSA